MEHHFGKMEHHFGKLPEVPFAEALPRFAEYRKSENPRTFGIETRYRLNRLLTRFKGFSLSEITAVVIQDLVDERLKSVARDTVKKEISAQLKDWGISKPVTFIKQKSMTGSGGAVLEALPFLKKFQTAIVMCGDAPLSTFDTLYSLFNHHRSEKGQVTMLTARLHNPQGYGRIVRSPVGEVLRIVEESQATAKEAASCCGSSTVIRRRQSGSRAASELATIALLLP